jgi:hypothetical protein
VSLIHAHRLAAALVFTAVAFVSTAAHAQETGTRTPVANKNVISANPFLLMAEYFNAEFERKHTDSSTFGLSASSVGLDDANYRNLQAFYRYYPQRASLTGFYIGGRAGVHRVSGDNDAGNAFGLGFEVGYSWLFGAERHFGVSIGAGATRLFGGDLDDASFVIPTVRLINVGWSF